MKRMVHLLAALWVAGCTQKPAEPPPRAIPRPLVALEPLTDDAGADEDVIHRVTRLNPVGPPVPARAQVVVLAADASLPPGDLPVLLVAEGEVYVAQVAPLLAALDEAHRQVWLKHPDAAVAFPVVLRDGPAFQRWLDEPVPGKVRVIHRADGFEVMTNMGKLPGQDVNGPTVPTRGGQFDLTTLRRGLERVQSRFKDAPDVCFMPSFGMEVREVARAMAANFLSADQAYFEHVCLVYPRPP